MVCARLVEPTETESVANYYSASNWNYSARLRVFNPFYLRRILEYPLTELPYHAL